MHRKLDLHILYIVHHIYVTSASGKFRAFCPYVDLMGHLVNVLVNANILSMTVQTDPVLIFLECLIRTFRLN